MFILYDLIFLIVAAIHLPLYILRKKFHQGLKARLGILAPQPGLHAPIWIHAVSVGEAMAVRNLVQRLREAFPGRKFVISTVTATGNKIAREIGAPGDLVTYLPFDISFIIRSVVAKINPSLFIIAETELWPNLISCLHKRKVPIVTVNGRISDASFRGYSAIKFLLKPVLTKVSLFCVQTDTDRSRLMALGVSADNIRVSGNMKFDSAVFSIDADSLIRCRRALAIGAADKLWVCGSTHTGEEGIILAVYAALLAEFGALKLLIAPRHPERAGEVERIIAGHGFKPLRISALGDIRNTDDEIRTTKYGRPNARAVFILDTVGELINYYAISDVVFMGASLVKKGGHNFLEPSLLEKPVVTGPYMSNFRDLSRLFIENHALAIVKDAQGLQDELRRLLLDAAYSAAQAQAARALILKNQGALERNIQYLRDYISR